MGKRVIYVNPVTMETENWNMYMADTRARLLSGEEVNNLVCFFSNRKSDYMPTELSQLVPLSRHSPLPELQAFVKLFRPKRVVPNTLDPRLKGLDWACIDQMFSSCLHLPAHRLLSADSLGLHLAITPNDHLAVNDQLDGDVALKNLVGNGAVNAAARWADQGKLLKKLSFLRDHLGDEANALIDQLLGVAASRRRASEHPSPNNAQLVVAGKGKGKEVRSSRDHGRDSEDDTDDCDSGDERGRTAHKLFAGLAGIDSDDKENTWWVSSQPSDEGQEVDPTLDGIFSGSPQKGRGEPVGDGAWRLNRLTPISSPVRQPQLRIPKHCPQTPSPLRPHTAHRTTQSPILTLQEPLSFLTHSPVKVSKLSAGHSLASPICLLSSSSPIEIAFKKKRQPHASGSNPIRGQSAQDMPFASSKPRALVFSIHPDTCSSQAPKEPTNPMHSQNLPASSLARQSGKLSSRAVQNARSWDTTPTPSKRRPGEELSPSLRLSKRPRLESKTTKATEHTTHTALQNIPTSIALSSTSAAASITTNLPTDIQGPDLQEQQQSSPSIPWVYSEQDMIQVKRIDMSQQLATLYPHLVAPTYAQKLDKQIENLKRKKQEDLLAAVGSSLAPHLVDGQAQPPRTFAHSPTRPTGAQKLGVTRTILSFETVEDDDGGMDWNRSRQLIDALREDLKSGRKPKLPPLVCAQSPSQSLDTSNDS